MADFGRQTTLAINHQECGKIRNELYIEVDLEENGGQDLLDPVLPDVFGNRLSDPSDT